MWMYQYVCSIKPVKAGFRTARIEPHVDSRLSFVEGTLNTAAGVYKSSWKYEEDGTVTYEVEVPFHAQAELMLDGKSRMLTAGRYTFQINRT